MGLLGYAGNMYFIAVYSAALTPTLRSIRGQDTIAAGESDVGTTISWAILLCLLTIWTLRHFQEVVSLSRHLGPYVVIVGLCFISAAWSPYPMVTIRRSVTLSICIVYGTYLFLTFGMSGICTLVARLMVILALLSLAVYVAIPSLGHDLALGYSSAMRGVFSTKNTAGEGMVLGMCCHLYLGSRPGARRWPTVLAVVLMYACVVLTKSVTSLLIATLVIGLGGFFWFRRPHFRVVYFYVVGAVCLTLLTVVLFDFELLFAAIGRDSSLTGRLPLWEMVLKSIAIRPWLGYGYSGFWNAESRDVQYLWQVIGWPSPAAHNGFLDIALQIGVIGLFLYMAMWTRVIQRNLTAIRAGGTPETAWITMFMMINVLLNLDEGPLPYPDEFTMLMPACLLFLGQTEDARARERKPPGLRLATPLARKHQPVDTGGK